MRLTNYTDYSLRVLIYLATVEPGRLSQIKEIADSYSISKNHLMKVTYQLGKLGYIETIRGRNGGIKLAKNPKEINIGEVVKQTEEDFLMVECFDEQNNSCKITSVCGLKHILNEALQAYLTVLSRYTLADIITSEKLIREVLS
ncbi:Rrf2 family transcriptional regulator [Bacillus carboniphilus]|uniref:HTH-type transcriptional regulator NsrR n=1 Tax=Bacillus carboniphilus TaxID=86663 RepID=A0ABY9JWT3_9BACI|nr:Rrf2 family transcriptional regulator [Bacillus carboniphilus]WLR42753.1 Rrf2 family transcriptional regulator [Bacillus carboniphilus]